MMAGDGGETKREEKEAKSGQIYLLINDFGRRK
jgi:hypothetical protein